MLVNWLRSGEYGGLRCRFIGWLNQRDSVVRLWIRYRLFHRGLKWAQFKTGVAMGCSQF
jgi:hypothetical protein